MWYKFLKNHLLGCNENNNENNNKNSVSNLKTKRQINKVYK